MNKSVPTLLGIVIILLVVVLVIVIFNYRLTQRQAHLSPALSGTRAGERTREISGPRSEKEGVGPARSEQQEEVEERSD